MYFLLVKVTVISTICGEFMSLQVFFFNVILHNLTVIYFKDTLYSLLKAQNIIEKTYL